MKPPIVAVLNQKGGSGKTTLSTNLAVSLTRRGLKTLLVDTDPQGSARDWNEAAGHPMVPVIGLDRESLGKDLLALELSGYDFVLIDGAAKITRLSAAAVRASDAVLIPLQPSPYDVWACAELIELVKTRQEVADGRPKASFAITMEVSSTSLAKEVEAALAGYELPQFETRIAKRTDYARSAAAGESVFETKNKQAIEEMDAFTDEFLAWMEVARELQG